MQNKGLNQERGRLRIQNRRKKEKRNPVGLKYLVQDDGGLGVGYGEISRKKPNKPKTDLIDTYDNYDHKDN